MEYVEKTAKEYSKCCEIDLESKLKPINKSVDDMLARLEEFETMMSFVIQDRKDYNDILTSVPNYKEEFDILCNKIDSVEKLTKHIKSNLDELEKEIEKAELSLGCTEKTAKVTQIFTPLFKKNVDKKSTSQSTEFFKTEDYFN
ncbi:biogenesis of lysosome-related organelles complex 1 subunit 4 isoform X2 [Diorhabda carinulata]|uniref:biogenesis of lysosome-related organelles complex 1 subunit 4 isoform X2 n=1 Tax=Diorhabda carinulata TaxID=1163345 RepID=UPI0025A03B6A|nr:biogenesis of lysosome-related organelles complex 1 subunit 4 isoform X2 [Diorhabda carinulata]